MEAKPLQVVPSSHNTSGAGCGPHKKIDMGHMMESLDDVVEEKRVNGLVKEENPSSTFELDLLGVGANSAVESEEVILSTVTVARGHRKCCLFTEAQRLELDHQVGIYNHFASNLPLPHHLVRSVSNKHISRNMSEYSSQGFHYGIMVDPEPNRCRRTDGKKWRCCKNVVPDQKYCERHMHRGRNRSRKPVEPSEFNSPPITNPSGKLLHAKLASNTEPELPSKNLCIVNTSSSTTNDRLKNITGSASKVTTFNNIELVTSESRSSFNMCKKDSQNKSCSNNNNICVKSGGKGSIMCDSTTTSISTGIGFSPKSVLQGCNNSYTNERNKIIELELGRCRRTDGKKWRCKRDVLPGQKYCATHMHRGAKRRFENHEPTTTTTVTTTSDVTISKVPTTNIQKAACCTVPSTNLSMSIPESARLIQCNEKSRSSSSDTDTTIYDNMNDYSSYASF